MLENIEVKGLRFSVRYEMEDSLGEPWEEHDVHGVVPEWTRRSKYPDERILAEDHGSKRYYAFNPSLYIARRDGWGLSDEERAALYDELGREPTTREIRAEAVERDYQRMRAWCQGEWSWIGVVVTLLDADGHETDENASLWGIESDSGAYLDEVALELANEIVGRVGDASERTKDTLEKLVDTHGLSAVLVMLSEVAGAKAQHLRENWQDEYSAKAWDTLSRRIDKTATDAHGRAFSPSYPTTPNRGRHQTMTDNTHNGWTNYETWNAALWMDNEEGSQRYWADKAREAYDSAEADSTFTREEQAALDLSTALRDEHESNVPDLDASFYSDILNAALSEVNWYEIAEHLISDVDKTADEDEDESGD